MERTIDHPALKHVVLMTKEAAEILRYDESTIREMLRVGSLRGFRYKKQWRIYRESVLFRLQHGFEAEEPATQPQAVDAVVSMS